MRMVIPVEACPLLSAATVALVSVNYMLMNATPLPRGVLQHVSAVSHGRTAY
jgi:hypothetical protein